MLTADSTVARRSGRLWHVAIATLIGLLLAELVVMVQSTPAADLGTDYSHYSRIGQRWFADGTYYLPRQLEGVPYALIPASDNTYPPTMLLLFVPLAILGAPFWWGVSIAVMLYVIWWLRPQPWAVCAMLVLLMWPRAIGSYLWGNSDIWMVALVAGGIRWGWPAVLLTVKPTLAPLALIGIKHRSWWVAAILLALVSLPMLPLWLQYVTVVRNVQFGLDYSIGALPLVFIPVVAWVGSRSPTVRRDTSAELARSPGARDPSAPGSAPRSGRAWLRDR